MSTYLFTLNVLKKVVANSTPIAMYVAGTALWDSFKSLSRSQKFKDKVKWIKTTEEKGESNRYHLQGMCKTGKDCTFEQLRELFPEGTHFELKKTTEEIDEGLDYLSDESEVAGFKSHFDAAPRTLVMGSVPVKYSGSDVLKTEQLYSWQKELEKELEFPPDSRKIIWYVDVVGNNGKSALLKYLVHHGGIAWSSGSGTINDISFSASGDINSTRVFIIDYPRHVNIEEDVNYDALEKFKDGLMSINKYKSYNATFKPKHVVVFANSEPDYSKMSKDRWDIRFLENKRITTCTRKVGMEDDEEESVVDVVSTPPSKKHKPNPIEEIADNSDEGSGISLGLDTEDDDVLEQFLSMLEKNPDMKNRLGE